MQNIDGFIKKVRDFNGLGLSSQVDCFAYYLLKITNMDGIKPMDIGKLFNCLRLPPHSNIPQYLRNNSKRNNKKSVKYFVKTGKYYMTPFGEKEVEEKYLRTPPTIKISNNLFPVSLFEKTRPYIEKVAYQAIACFDYGLYDACNVMLRRLLETLIIETFEKNGISNIIKNSQGDFYYLDDLIKITINETSFNLSRNCKSGLKEIKRNGDLSAHNRRFIAKREDIEKLSKDLRVVYQEFLQLIDYSSWIS